MLPSAGAEGSGHASHRVCHPRPRARRGSSVEIGASSRDRSLRPPISTRGTDLGGAVPAPGGTLLIDWGSVGPGDRGQAERARDGGRVGVRSTAKVRPIERRGRGVGERRGGAGTDAGRAGVRAAQERDGGGPLSGGSANVGRVGERQAGASESVSGATGWGRATSGWRHGAVTRRSGRRSRMSRVPRTSSVPGRGGGGARRHHLASRVRLTSARRWTWRGHDGVRDLAAGWERRVALC